MYRVHIIPLVALLLLVVGIFVGCGGPAKGSAEWHADQGYKLFNEGNYDEAIKECTEAIGLAPDLAEAYSNRGIAYVQKGELDQAIADFDKAIEIDLELAKAYNDRGYAYYLKGDVAKAVSDFEKCIELSNDPRLVAKAQQLLDELR
ncbi:tetratricopeptide repeat protein [Chloroflexota bacterium]